MSDHAIGPLLLLTLLVAAALFRTAPALVTPSSFGNPGGAPGRSSFGTSDPTPPRDRRDSSDRTPAAPAAVAAEFVRHFSVTPVRPPDTS